MDSLNSARDALDSGARTLAGEPVDPGLDAGMVEPSAEISAELPPPEVSDFDQEAEIEIEPEAGDLDRERR